MLLAIAHHQIVGAECIVVAKNLVKDLLRNLDRSSLVFDYHQWRTLFIIHHRVTALLGLAYTDGNLDSYPTGRISQLLYHVMDKVLPYPLLRRESHILASLGAQYLLDTSLRIETDAMVIRREGQGRELIQG